MRPRILCGWLLLVGCGSDPVASEPASWTSQGPSAPHVAVSPVAKLVELDRPAYAITIDQHDVYFTTDVSSSIAPVVWRCAKGGCDAATPIASGNAMPNDIAVDGANVYWIAANGTLPLAILACPIGVSCGADPRIVTFQDPILDIASDGATLFWLGDGTVRACDGSNCDATTRVVVSDTDALQISIDAGDLWFRNFVDESIVRCAIADCRSTEARVATNFAFTPFALDATSVYFRTPAGISRCAKTGCRKPSVIAPLDKDASVTDIVADGAHVYWIDRQSVRACPITGCTKPATIALTGANRLAQDDQYLYWTAGSTFGALASDKTEHHGPGAIFRVAK